MSVVKQWVSQGLGFKDPRWCLLFKCKRTQYIYILMDVFYKPQPAYDLMYSVAYVRMVVGFGCHFVYTLRIVCYYGFALVQTSMGSMLRLMLASRVFNVTSCNEMYFNK